MDDLNLTLRANSGLDSDEPRAGLMKTGLEMLSNITERWKEEGKPFATIPDGSLGPIGGHLVVLPLPSESSIRIARGAKRQMLFIESGDRLDAVKHSSERVCSLVINHSADGTVSVMPCDTPFDCSIAQEKSGDRYGRSYTTNHPIASGKTTKLLAGYRTNGVWTIRFGNRHYKLEITPGATLVVTHKPG